MPSVGFEPTVLASADSNLQSRQASGRRPTAYTARSLGSAAFYLIRQFTVYLEGIFIIV
jgi:hypothetical protein